MSKFILTDWEINGYDDSDFMCSYYDNVAKTIGFTCYGSTRYPSASAISIGGGTTSVVVDGSNLLYPDAEVVEEARQLLQKLIFEKLVAADKRLCDSPDVEDLSKGLKVQLISSARMQLRASESCNKCSGSGKWINPRNANDKRDCFACKGSGQHVGAKVKNEDGKQAYEVLQSGLVGEVVDWTSFGKFYANGYNKPNRDNTTVQIRIEGGRVVRASLSKLSLERGYRSPEELQERAKDLSLNYNFSALYPRFAWDTTNFALHVVAQGIKDKCDAVMAPLEAAHRQAVTDAKALLGRPIHD